MENYGLAAGNTDPKGIADPPPRLGSDISSPVSVPAEDSRVYVGDVMAAMSRQMGAFLSPALADSPLGMRTHTVYGPEDSAAEDLALLCLDAGNPTPLAPRSTTSSSSQSLRVELIDRVLGDFDGHSDREKLLKEWDLSLAADLLAEETTASLTLARARQPSCSLRTR